jgi:hypothetical protein
VSQESISRAPNAGAEQNKNHQQIMRALPWLWLALSVIWAVVIFVTDLPALSLAVWIAATVGPIAALQSRLRSADRAA